MIWERYNYTTHISEDSVEINPNENDPVEKLLARLVAIEALADVDSDDVDAGEWDGEGYNMQNGRGEWICIRPKN